PPLFFFMHLNSALMNRIQNMNLYSNSSIRSILNNIHKNIKNLYTAKKINWYLTSWRQICLLFLCLDDVLSQIIIL
ncbi:hypothetical protein ACJX0J_011073, partial [Zea mays]